MCFCEEMQWSHRWRSMRQGFLERNQSIHSNPITQALALLKPDRQAGELSPSPSLGVGRAPSAGKEGSRVTT